MLQNLDWAVLAWIRSTFSCGFLDFLMPKLTLLGDGGAVWIAAAIALLCTKRYRRFGVWVLAGMALGVLVGNGILKNLVARPRPCWLDKSVPLLIANPTDYSFPSGHALSSAIASTVLTRANRAFAWAAIPLTLIISFSRMYLYVHFPSDVLGGLLLGLVIGLVVCFAGEALHARRQARKK
jgi:undecaprenyl-diphosphatase